MEIRNITGKQCKATRSLWEEVFNEDSEQFTDYYFEHKAEKNIGYVIGEAPYDAMMFRTPYQLRIGKEQKKISYLVGVATRKECRHQGYMRSLLMHSFREMYEEKQPFTFLMPANPDIYEPFDFKYIYERDVWGLKDGVEIEELLKESQLNWYELKAAEIHNNDKNDAMLEGMYRVGDSQEQFPDIPILGMLADFANEYLKEHFNIYVHRNEAYYDMQMKELAAQNGEIYVLFEQSKIKAFFLYAKEESEVFIQEVVGEEEDIPDFLQKEEAKKPIIMARIIHLEEMLKLVCCKEHRKFTIEIEDDLLPENTGTYDWEITPNGSKVSKIQPDDGYNQLNAMQVNGEGASKEEVISMHIRELAPMILKGVFINEIV